MGCLRNNEDICDTCSVGGSGRHCLLLRVYMHEGNNWRETQTPQDPHSPHPLYKKQFINTQVRHLKGRKCSFETLLYFEIVQFNFIELNVLEQDPMCHNVRLYRIPVLFPNGSQSSGYEHI